MALIHAILKSPPPQQQLPRTPHAATQQSRALRYGTSDWGIVHKTVRACAAHPPFLGRDPSWCDTPNPFCTPLLRLPSASPP